MDLGGPNSINHASGSEDLASRPPYETPPLDQINAVQSRIEQLTCDLEKERRQHASLRSHLQLKQDPDSQDILDGFQRITRAIQDFSFDMSERGTETSQTTLNAADVASLAAFCSASNAPPVTLVFGENGVGRDMETFLEYSLRHVISAGIYDAIFASFHPDLRLSPGYEGLDVHLTKTYAQIRQDRM